MTQQGTPFYPAGMSASDWSMLVFTLPRRKIAWVHPTKATFFQCAFNTTLQQDFSAVPLFGCLCYTMWAMPLCNDCLFCIRSMLAGNKQPGSWSCFACHSHKTIGDAFLPRQQSTGSAQRRGSPLTVGLPYIFCHTSYRNLASFASFPASCHCMFRAGRVYAEELDAGP